jgi:hypothetical protein
MNFSTNFSTSIAKCGSIAFGLLLGSFTLANAGNPVECAAYANQAVMQQGNNLQNSCGYSGPRWSSNFGAHLAWCLNAPTSVINAERNARINMLAACAGAPGPGPAPGGQAKVCVWDLPNYNGASICVTAGMSDSQINAVWDNRVSSLKVYNGAKIKLCQNPGYLGFCNTFSSDRALLGNALNNQASSYQVFE